MLKKSICIGQLIQENVSTQKSLHKLIYVINKVHSRVKQSLETTTRCPIVLNIESQYIEGSFF